MAYVNLASTSKLHRTSRLITDIGTGGLLLVYSGTIPPNPDFAPTGTLLATLPLSSTAGVASLAVQEAFIANAGTGGSNGTYALTFAAGGGTGAAGYYVVSDNKITSAVISAPGTGYTSAPTISGFGTAGLTGASVLPVMTGLLTFSAITPATAVANGFAAWARVTKADLTGIIDLDVGITNAASAVINNTAILAGASVTCAAEVLIEA